MSKTTLKNFLNHIQENSSEITYLCSQHFLFKIYPQEETQEDEEYLQNDLINHLKNYPQLMRYLNDYAGTIYRKYNSSVDDVYAELSKLFDFRLDNEYTIAHIIKKLEKQTPALLMSLTDEDIQIQTIENYIEKLNDIIQSAYYQENLDSLEETVEKLQKNIDLVKRALQM